MAELRLIRSEPEPAPQEPLWREAVGRRLRSARLERGEKLTDTASRAGVSPQYLSEVERGRKDPSSEMIAALAGALDLTLIDLAQMVADDLRVARTVVRAIPARRTPAPARRASEPQALLSLAA